MQEFNELESGLESTKLIHENLDLIKNFIKIQWLRSPKSLQEINDNSFSSRIFGNLDPSELIKLTPYLKSNLLLAGFISLYSQ